MATSTSVLVGLGDKYKTSQSRSYMQLSDIRTRHNQTVCSQMRSVPCSKIGINLVNVTSSVSLLIYDDVLAVSFPTSFLDSCKGTSNWCFLPPRKHCCPSLLYSHTVGSHLLPHTSNEFNYMIWKHQRGFSSLRFLLNPLKSVPATGFPHLNSKQL